jgi:diacylglycerol kinase (ATP)
MRMEGPKDSPCDLIAPSDLPHSLHAFRRVPKTDPQDMVTMLDITISFP